MVKITFLGTSDAIPSVNRNHSSILLNYKEENILFDCGEGTQRQFRKAKLNPCKITRILISHWHGDHVLGISGLLATLGLSGYNKHLFIYGPKGTKEKMKQLLELFPFIREYEITVEEVMGRFFENADFYLEAEEMEHGLPCNAYNFVKKGQIRIDKQKLKKYKISPGPLLKNLKENKDIEIQGKKYKVSDLTFKEDDLKISVVMDTKMNKKIIPFVKDANIFVCESAYSSELEKEAEEHKHMIMAQVAEIAKKANVKKLILTHISSRHMRELKDLSKEVKNIFSESYFVKDFDFFLL